MRSIYGGTPKTTASPMFPCLLEHTPSGVIVLATSWLEPGTVVGFSRMAPKTWGGETLRLGKKWGIQKADNYTPATEALTLVND